MSESIETGLLCKENLPVRWRVIAEEEIRTTQIATHLLNEERFRVINTLDDHRPESLEDNPGLSQELQKIDFKLNLILEMLGPLVAAGSDSPVTLPVLLTPHRLTLTCPDTVAVNSWLEIELFLHARYPFPVVLVGQLDRVVSVAGETSMEVALLLLSEPAQEQYEKYLFRCHRRQIARAKKS